ncbi:MAG: phosphate ABC transporter substrate-binding protein [Bacteroidota bacterium]|nr:phosphate ABC transporter substrate-binding protein [Bacteroidota bacterium]
MDRSVPPERERARFQVTGGGSGTGVAALINGTTDICASSRPLRPAEIRQLQEKYGTRGVEVRVARDGLAVYVNRSNPVSKLTQQQVRDIFTGKLTNWRQVGGPDARIILYSRENNSGTYEFFKEHVLQGQDFAPHAQHMPGTAALVNAIAKDRWGIGYGGAAYATDIKAVAIAEAPDKPYYLPTLENVVSGRYPISRFLYFYLRERPSGELKAFIDWVLSDDGQRVISEVGYFPVRPPKRREPQ